jgi:hypothetical protein
LSNFPAVTLRALCWLIINEEHIQVSKFILNFFITKFESAISNIIKQTYRLTKENTLCYYVCI